MTEVRVIADEIHFRGELVGVLTSTGVVPSTMGDFTDALELGFAELEAQPEPCECAHMKECPNHKAENASNTDNATFDEVMRDLNHNLKPYARGGLVKFADIENIVKQLIEEKGLE